jgi:hypothetical protein
MVSTGTHATPPRPTAAALHPGIVLAPDARTVHAADRAGRVHAIALADGRSRWQTAYRALPLGWLGGRLLALAQPDGVGRAEFLWIDPADGTIDDRVEIELPADVVAQFMPQPRRRFDIHALVDADGLEIHWQYQRRPLRGALLADGAGNPIVSEPEVIDRHGVVRIRDDGGALSVSEAAVGNDGEPFSARAVADDQRLAGLDGDQWLASDDGAVMASTFATGTSGIPGNVWTIHARDGERLGVVESAYAWAPFLVVGKLMLYRIDPVMTDIPGEGRVEHGSRLIAHDFATGKVRWSFDALERRYFGPLPP